MKKFLPRSLLGRSLMILVVPIILIQLITTYFFFDKHWGKMTDRLAFAVAAEIAVIANQVEYDYSPERLKEVTQWAGQNLEMLVSFEPEAEFGEDEKNAYSGLRDSAIAESLGTALEAQVRRPFHISIDSHEKWVETSLQLENGVLRLSVPQRRLFSSSAKIFLLWMFFTSLILLAVAVLFMRNQVRPIRRLAVVAERFGKGIDAPGSFKPEGAREVRQAGQAFLDMQERIRRQIQQRTAMLSGVSHDLRTPLTRMKLQAAMLGNDPDVEALKKDIAEMERMIDAYLDFARGEGGEQAARTELKPILERLVAGAKRQGAEISLVMHGDLALQVRPVAFERCLGNLITNARKYGGNVWVEARRGEGGVDITIDDDGPGIPEDKMQDVFRPFYRLEGSRNSATGGVGLGLPIAQDIITSHGGEINLKRSPRGGLRVAIRMPV